MPCTDYHHCWIRFEKKCGFVFYQWEKFLILADVTLCSLVGVKMKLPEGRVLGLLQTCCRLITNFSCWSWCGFSHLHTFYAFVQYQLRQTSTYLKVLFVLCCASFVYTDREWGIVLFYFHFRNVYRCAVSFQNQSLQLRAMKIYKLHVIILSFSTELN